MGQEDEIIFDGNAVSDAYGKMLFSYKAKVAARKAAFFACIMAGGILIAAGFAGKTVFIFIGIIVIGFSFIVVKKRASGTLRFMNSVKDVIMIGFLGKFFSGVGYVPYFSAASDDGDGVFSEMKETRCLPQADGYIGHDYVKGRLRKGSAGGFVFMCAGIVAGYPDPDRRGRLLYGSGFDGSVMSFRMGVPFDGEAYAYVREGGFSESSAYLPHEASGIPFTATGDAEFDNLFAVRSRIGFPENAVSAVRGIAELLPSDSFCVRFCGRYAYVSVPDMHLFGFIYDEEMDDDDMDSVASRFRDDVSMIESIASVFAEMA